MINLETLHPVFKEKFEKFCANLAAKNIKIIPISGHKLIDIDKFKQGKFNYEELTWANFGLEVEFNIDESISLNLAKDYGSTILEALTLNLVPYKETCSFSVRFFSFPPYSAFMSPSVLTEQEINDYFFKNIPIDLTNKDKVEMKIEESLPEKEPFIKKIFKKKSKS